MTSKDESEKSKCQSRIACEHQEDKNHDYRRNTQLQYRSFNLAIPAQSLLLCVCVLCVVESAPSPGHPMNEGGGR